MRKIFFLTMMTLVGTMFCSAHKSHFVNKEPKRFPKTFVNAINEGNYNKIIKQVSSIDFTYYGDAIDRQVDMEKFEAFIHYVEKCSWIPDDVYYQMWSYYAKAFLSASQTYLYSLKDNETAFDLVTDALEIFSQIGESRVYKYIADSYFIMGNIYLSNKDTLSARDALIQASTIYKKWNVINLDYIESLFYLAIAMPRTDYHNGNGCELAQVWDDCYDVFLETKKSNMLPDDYFLNESKILRYAISAYIDCGLKHKWNYEFDEAEEAFLTAIERNNRRKVYTTEPIETLGDIEQYLMDCRKMRLEVEHWGETMDIFSGDGRCEMCTPSQQLIKAIGAAEHYHGIGDFEQTITYLQEAHDLIEKVDSVPISIAEVYHSLCLSIKKEPSVLEFLTTEDIARSFDFLYAVHRTLADSLRVELEYANSLIPMNMKLARQILDDVDVIMSNKELNLINTPYYYHLQFLYLTSLIGYDMAYNNGLYNDMIKSEYLASKVDIESNEEIMHHDIQEISSMWQKIKDDIAFKDNVDVQFKVPAVIVLLASQIYPDEQLCQKWAIDYLKNKKVYLSKYISLIPESQRDAWLDNDNLLRAESGIFGSIIGKKNIPNDIITELYNNELLSNQILFKSSQSVRQYLGDNEDAAAELLYRDLQEKKKNFNNKRLIGIVDNLLQDSILQIERVLSETTREYRTESIIEESPRWSDIRKKLKKNEVAIEFVSYGVDNYGAFVLRNSMKTPVWVELANPYLTEQTIDELRPYFQLRAKGDNFGYYLQIPDSIRERIDPKLYDAIWKPLTKYIDRGDIVYYAPKGMINYIPLQSLFGADSVYLCDKYDLRVLTSTGSLVNRARGNLINRDVVAYGGIFYNQIATVDTSRTISSTISIDRGRVQYLPFSMKEVCEIASICSEHNLACHVYSGSYATEQSVLSLSEQEISVLHFATHSHVYGDAKADDNMFPLDRVGLCLYNANATLAQMEVSSEPIMDGILRASEVSNLDFSRTDLVVLSACNTGLGDITSDGVAGLQRGFKMAGVNSIMMSLWPVDDAATYLLMKEFYRNYLGGKTKTESLREAQRYLRNYEQDGEKIFADPKYWAAFILLDALD